ncbi:LacI family DNA-binding transcriptional regulator [Roseobacter weihaiensis]|uniref:LacI family DNA-binding transcriptional regulator n=1 Tax=Roseobacter weihaiensis TaxID=2763262 RepID=UPI00222234D1|nr:LacI family DNA-binding transcriptional regulator [Roseobacter sp. H9]
MHDVARVAGVSQMTVSRVMRGSGYISKDVRKEVVTAAREIGYVHNRLAGGNASYDNPIVGVVVPTMQNRVFTEVLSGISATLDESGLRPVFGVSEYSLDAEEDLVFDLLSWRPRGLILPGLEHTASLRKIVAQTGVRVAEIMDTDGDPISACFGFSHIKAGEDMAKHLIDRGYRTFGYVGSQGGLDLRATKRFEAFARIINEAGAQIVAVETSEEASSMDIGRAVTNRLMQQDHPPSAIYYANDDLAAGGLMHCLAEAIPVPDEIALAGFNGLAFLSALPKLVTTTVTPRFDIGIAAARWLMQPENNTAEHKIELPANLRIGQTT